MSVKQKFRKSKKTKGKSNKNKKYDNEKRSKIQRKTKKRVLKGGDDVKVSSTRGFFARRLFRNQDITREQCEELKDNIKKISESGNNPVLTERAEEDKNNCLNLDPPIDVLLETEPVAPPPSERNSLTEEGDDEPVDFISAGVQENAEVGATNESGDAEAALAVPAVAAPAATEEDAATTEEAAATAPVPAEKTNTETPPAGEAAEASPVAAEASPVAEAAADIKSKKIEEAMKQVKIDQSLGSSILGNSVWTLKLAEKHDILVSKYKKLKSEAEDDDLKTIYEGAEKYHQSVYNKLKVAGETQKIEADLLRQKELNVNPSPVAETAVVPVAEKTITNSSPVAETAVVPVAEKTITNSSPVAETAVVPPVNDKLKALFSYLLKNNDTDYTDIDFLSILDTQTILKKDMIHALKKSLITSSYLIAISLKKDVTEENKTKLAYLAGFLVAVILNNPMIEFKLTFPKHYLDLFFMLQHAPVIVNLCKDILLRITLTDLSSKPFLSLVKKQDLLFGALLKLSVNIDSLFCVRGSGTEKNIGDAFHLPSSNPRKVMTKFIQEQLQPQIQNLQENREKELFVSPEKSKLSVEQLCREKIFPFIAEKIILSSDGSEFEFYIHSETRDDFYVSEELKNIVSSFTDKFKKNFTCSQNRWIEWNFHKIDGLLFTLMFANSILFLEKLPASEKRTYKLLEIFKDMLFSFYSACVESFNKKYMKLVSGCLTCPLFLESPPSSEYGIFRTTKFNIKENCGKTFIEIPCIDVFKDNFLKLLQLLFSTSVTDEVKKKSTSEFIEYYLAFLEIRYKNLTSDSEDPDVTALFFEVGTDDKTGLRQMNKKFSIKFSDKQLPSNFLVSMFTPNKEQDFSLVDLLKGQPLDLTKTSQKDKIIEFLKLFKEAFDIENFKDVLFGKDGSRSGVDIFGNIDRESSDVWSLPLLLQKAQEIFNSLKFNPAIIKSHESQFDYLQGFMPTPMPAPAPMNVPVVSLDEITRPDSSVSNEQIYTFKIEGRRSVSILGFGKLTTFYAKIIEKDSKKYIVYSDDFSKINVADTDLESSIRPWSSSSSSSSLHFIYIPKTSYIVSDESDASNKKISFDGTDEQNITKKFTLMFESKDTNHFVEFKRRLEEIQSSRSEYEEERDDTYIVSCRRNTGGKDDTGFCGLVADGLFSNFEIRGSSEKKINDRLNYSLDEFQAVSTDKEKENFVDLRLCMNFMQFDKDSRYYLMFMAPDMIEPTKYLGGESLLIPTDLSVLYVQHKFSFDTADERNMFKENIESKEIPERDLGLSFVKVYSEDFDSTLSLTAPYVFCGFDRNNVYLVTGSTPEITRTRITADMTKDFPKKYIDLTTIVELKINSDNTSFTFTAPTGVSDELSNTGKQFTFTFDDSYTRDFFFNILDKKCEIAKSRKKQFMITKCKKLEIITQKWVTAYFSLYASDDTIVIVANSLHSAISSIYVTQIGSSKENYIDLKNVSFETTQVGNSVGEIVFKDNKTADELFTLKSYDDSVEKKEEIVGISSKLASIKSEIDKGHTSTSTLNVDCEQFNFNHEKPKDEEDKDKPKRDFFAMVKGKIVKVIDSGKTAIMAVKDTLSGPWTNRSIVLKGEHMYVLDKFDDPLKGKDIKKLTPEESQKLLIDNAEKLRDISKKNIELVSAPPQFGNKKVIQIEYCQDIKEVYFEKEKKPFCVQFKAPQSYGSANMVLYCFAFKSKEDQNLFYKALVERKDSLQRKTEPVTHQQRVAEQQVLKDVNLELGDLPVQSFKIYVKDSKGIVSEKEVNAINCFQFDPNISRSVFKSSIPDVCAISGDFFVRASPGIFNKFGNLEDRLTALLSSDQKSIQSAPEECKNHCFDFTKCSALAPLTDSTESQFKDGLTFMGPETIGSKTIVSHRFYFASEKERDYALLLLKKIIDRANLKPFDDTSADTGSQYIRCSVKLPSLFTFNKDNILCAFTQEFLCFEKDTSTLTDLVSSPEKKNKDNSIAFAGINKIDYDDDEFKVKIFTGKSDYYEFDLKDFNNYKLFEEKLRRNYSISQSKLSESASTKVSSAIPVPIPKSMSDISEANTPVVSPSNRNFFSTLAAASGIRVGGGENQNTKNKTKHSTKTKHKSNHKAKAKTQSKPKHKNKSKTKPKHRVKPKTIKKNKRAHHKFDKKYTRKR